MEASVSRSGNVRVVLVCGYELREVNVVCHEVGVRASLLARYVAVRSVHALSELYRALSDHENIFALVESIVPSHCLPQFVVGRRKRKLLGPPYWLFDASVESLKSTWLPPIVIYLDESTFWNVPFPPRWIRHVMCRDERKTTSLIALNAYVSTLGGGHYLCKHIPDAWAMALRQLAVALALGDSELAGQCRLHLVYICLQTGRLNNAKKRLQYEKRFARKIGSGKLEAMVFAAEVYLGKLRARKAELKKEAENKLHDDFYRQRFVELANRKTKST